uniref:Uncharacterized protein n=1 Tax=Solanum tuberosum TaxID=4113 RepID=M1DT07_SOLTU
MPSTRSQGEPLTPYDPELNRTLRRMNNQGIPVNPIGVNLGDAVELQQCAYWIYLVRVVEDSSLLLKTLGVASPSWTSY